MTTGSRLTIAAACGLAPLLLYSYATGPDPRHTGAPGDQTCARSGCHTGTALNGGGRSATLTSSEGATYTPGQKQTLTLTIADSRERVYGFQASARLDINPTKGQAGDFTAATQQIVICESGSAKGANGCPSSALVQFIEHTRAFSSNTISFSWTPPSSDVGGITIYVAANAANGNNDDSGDHIYTTSLKLTAAAAANQPTITAGGVVSAGAFRQGGIAPGTWIEIFGSNLSATTRAWESSDFDGADAPKSLDGVTVTIGGKSAYVDFVSPGQVNAQVPDGIPIGPGVQLVLRNGQAETDPYTLTSSDLAPALLAPPQFASGGKQFIAAVVPSTDGSVVFAGAPGLVSGVNTRPVKPGETVTLYGIGFGPVSPATTPGTAALADTVTNNVTVQIGGMPATISYSGLAPGFVGLYQFNVVAPNISAGDWPLVMQVNGTPVAQGLYITTGP